MFEPFLLRAGLAGLGVALAAGPLGCFVVWRRMAYFSDATAHAALLGVALALAWQAPVLLGVLVVALGMALTIWRLSEGGLALDTLLGVLAHGALAAGLVAVSFLPQVTLDLSAFLFGDILSVGWTDVAAIWAGATAILALLAWRWHALLTATLEPDLARAAGLDPGRERLVLVVTLALTVAVALKVVGALLIGALLIVPPAAARPLARTPEEMAAGAAAVGATSVAAGLWASLTWDTPTGPSIACAAMAIFALVTAAAALVRAR
ncbi:hypothetical protein DXV76_12180 [Rhodobacteraceae bacterium CCMM004]|nr:hypothetical protein DXV76_12180 [Rhodobacteraceae bacterium CCMM004]